MTSILKCLVWTLLSAENVEVEVVEVAVVVENVVSYYYYHNDLTFK